MHSDLAIFAFAPIVFCTMRTIILHNAHNNFARIWHSSEVQGPKPGQSGGNQHGLGWQGMTSSSIHPEGARIIRDFIADFYRGFLC